jgi:hypothetical protein
MIVPQVTGSKGLRQRVKGAREIVGAAAHVSGSVGVLSSAHLGITHGAAAKEATYLARKMALTGMILRSAEPGYASCRISTARASPPEKSPAVSCG